MLTFIVVVGKIGDSFAWIMAVATNCTRSYYIFHHHELVTKKIKKASLT